MWYERPVRQIARFEDEGTARTLADALYVDGIETRIDRVREGGHLLWVLDERDLERAKEILRAFEAHPGDERFERSRAIASERRRAARAEAKAEAKTRPRVTSMRERWSLGSGGIGRVTFGIIGVMIGLSIAMTFTNYEAIFRWLAYADYVPVAGVYLRTSAFAGLRDGQIWRLFTPAFVHAPLIDFSRHAGLFGLFGALHVLFNALWMRDLGSLVERAQGGLFLIVFVLVVGAIGNTAQYLWTFTPNFCGMSGVVLGLFSYQWVRAKLDRAGPYGTPPGGAWLIGFYLFGLLGFLPIANVVHTGGLVGGAVWGAAASFLGRRR